MFETIVGVELLEGYKRAVGDTRRYRIFGKIPWRTSPWIFHLWSVTQGFHTTIAKRFLVWRNSKERCVHCHVISRWFPRSVDIVAWPVQRRFAFCTSWKFLEVIQRSSSTSFPRDQKQQCRSRPQKFTIDIPSINARRKSMEEYWFLAPTSRLAISSASLNIFFMKLPVARAKQLGRSIKKTTSCKKATELPC